jgi:hypothetical protein
MARDTGVDTNLWTAYQCTKQFPKLNGEVPPYRWLGRKTACEAHKRYNFTLSASDELLVHKLPVQSPNQGN